MKFAEVSQAGGPEVFRIAETDPPVPEAGQVLIKVAAAGVNRADIFQREGRYPPPPGASPILGLEVAGEIVSEGSECCLRKTGEQVCALTEGGGYAEYVAVAETQCLPVPDCLNLIEAAALPETTFTVWSNVFDRAGLSAGESFLVHGGSSGIGTTAIQMACAMGAKVFTTAGSAEKCHACEALGAVLAVNYKEVDYVEAIKAASDDRGIDVILDIVGGDYIYRNIKLAAVDGRIVNIAFLKGSKAEINFLPVMMKRLTLSGSTLRARSIKDKAGIAEALQEHIWPHIENGKIKPVIAETFALQEVAQAHRLMESSLHIGKIVLTV